MNDAFSSELLLLSLRGSLLVLVIVAVRGLLGRRLPAQCLHLLWLLAAVKFLLPVNVPAAWSISNFAERAAHRGAPAVTETQWRITRGSAPAAEFAPVAGAASLAVRPSPLPAGPSPLTPIWLAGIAVQIGALLFAAARLRRRLRFASAVEDSRAIAIANHCRVRLGLRRTIPIFETSAVTQPSLYGFFRPRILIPEGLLARLDDARLRLVLLHEFNHARRRDIAALWLFTALRIVHWFNPVAWLAVRLARRDLEQACDAGVLRHAGRDSAAAYGRTLLELCRSASLRPFSYPVAGIIDTKAALAARLKRLTATPAHPITMRIATLLAVLAAGIAFGANETNPVTNPEPAPEMESAAAAKLEAMWISIPKGGEISEAEVDFRLPGDEFKTVKPGEPIDDATRLESIAWSGNGESAAVTIRRGDGTETLGVPGERVSQRGAGRVQAQIEFATQVYEIPVLKRRSFLRGLSDAKRPEADGLGLLEDALAGGKSVTILTPPQAGSVSQFLAARREVETASAPSVTTKAGQRAVIEIIRELRYPVEWKTDPPLAKPVTPVSFETRNCGITLELEPAVGGGSMISFTAVPQVTEFLGMADIETGARFPRKKTGRTLVERTINASGVPDVHGRAMKTVFSARKASLQIDLLSGYTALITGMAEADDVTPFERIAPKGQLILLMRARLIEAPPARIVLSAARRDEPAAPPIHVAARAEDGTPIPSGKPAPGKPGYVTSPYSEDGTLIDVRGLPPGTKVRCPITTKIFLVP